MASMKRPNAESNDGMALQRLLCSVLLTGLRAIQPASAGADNEGLDFDGLG